MSTNFACRSRWICSASCSYAVCDHKTDIVYGLVPHTTRVEQSLSTSGSNKTQFGHKNSRTSNRINAGAKREKRPLGRHRQPSGRGGISLCSPLLVWHGKLRILHIASSPSSAAVLPALPGLPSPRLLLLPLASISHLAWAALWRVATLQDEWPQEHTQWDVEREKERGRQGGKVAQPAAVCASCAFSLSSFPPPGAPRTEIAHTLLANNFARRTWRRSLLMANKSLLAVRSSEKRNRKREREREGEVERVKERERERVRAACKFA